MQLKASNPLGRIKVQYPWDRYGPKNHNSFCWVRVSGSGAYLPPKCKLNRSNQAKLMRCPVVPWRCIRVQLCKPQVTLS